MKISEDKRLDKRLVERNIKQGIVSQDEYEAHLKNLPDKDEAAVPLVVEMTDVGVSEVEATDTGEQE